MKLQITAALAITLISLSSYANWYVGGVYCKKDRADGTQTADAMSVARTTLEKYTVNIADPRKPVKIPDRSDYTGTYASVERINERTVWSDIFDFITIYDGMDLVGGNVGPIDGVVKESRTEIRFKKYTDIAYGPDYASVTVFVRNLGENAWTVKDAFPDCFVSVSH